MNRSHIYLKLIATTFMWAAVFHIGKFAVSNMPPGYVSAWRFLLAAVVLLALTRWRDGLDPATLRRNAPALLAMSAIGVVGFNVGMSYGLRETSAVNGALIMAFSPALTAVLAALVAGESISSRKITGLVLALAGVTVVVSKGSLHTLTQMSFSRGDLMVLLGEVGWSIYSVIPKRFVHGLTTTQITVSTVTGGALMLAVFGSVEPASAGLWVMPSVPVAGAIGFMGLFGSVLAYLWWNEGLGKLGAASGAVFINLVPVWATLIGLALGQEVSSAQWAGALLVMAGVWWSSRQGTSATRLPLNALAQPK
ncbi:MAG: DMT family transporter [Gammaproteobacteria bacterium]